MICIYHNDLDGRCSAAIVGKMHRERELEGSLEFISVDYKDTDNVRFMDTLYAAIEDEIVAIVDFSFKPDIMAKIRELASSIIWIDHHVTAKDYPYQDLPGLRCFENKKYAGCELTWMHFYPLNDPPEVVRMIGDYDKWALLIPESKPFHEVMKTVNTSPDLPIWDQLFCMDQNVKENMVKSGRLIMRYRDNYCRGLCNSFGYETMLDGVEAYACNQAMFGSGGFGEKFDQYPICIAFIYDGFRFTVSLYSATVDVGVIAKKYNGGGHKGAAGFICMQLPFKAENTEACGEVV